MNRPKISSQTLTTKNPLLMQPTSSTKKNDKRELKFASESENEKESPPILENPTHEEPTFMPVKTEKPPEPSPTQKISK